VKDFEGESSDDLDMATERARPRLKPPPRYKVILLNDDFTPMEFVVHTLQKFFGCDMEKATQLMLEVHTHGKAICGVFSSEIAETKVTQVNQYARNHHHPLLCTMEEN